MTFDPETTLPLIVCPKSHVPLVHDAGTLVNTDPKTRLQYQITDGIPVLLLDEATELDASTWGRIMQQHGRDPLTGTLIAGAHPADGEDRGSADSGPSSSPHRESAE